MSTRVLASRRVHGGVQKLEPNAAELPELLADPDAFVWVDIDERDEEAQRLLEEVFEFHPLLIEDAFAEATTPKVEDFGDYLYIIVHGLSDGDPADGEVQTADLDMFVGQRYLITHHVFDFAAVGHAREAVEANPALLARGPAVVAHAIVDRLVDEYLPLMERLDAEVDLIEARILSDSSPQLLERIFRMKHSLQRIRRIGLHQKDLLHGLASGRHGLIPEDVRPFYRDVYDHMVRVTDLNEVYRELMASSLDAYLGVQSHKLNEIMRVLTIFSTVMLPLTFVTGLYGMNFEVIPFAHWEYGFEVAMAIMAAVALAMVLFFKRRGWL